MTARRTIAAAFFGLFSVVNPSYITGCGAETEEVRFTYNESDMQEILQALNDEGAWAIESGGSLYRVELKVAQQGAAQATRSRTSEQTPFSSKAYACGVTRMFSSTASACDVEHKSTIEVEGTMDLFREQDGALTAVAEAQRVRGMLTVYGTSIERVELSVETEEGSLVLQSPNGSTFKVAYHEGLVGVQ